MSVRTLVLAASMSVAAVATFALTSCATPDEEGAPVTRPPQSAVPSSGSTGWHLKVLGVAQDGGYPHLGCVKEHCEAVRRGERAGAKVACLGLSDGERAWIFDATPDFASQVHDMGVREPEGVFLTHAHIGHYTGLIHLGKEVLGAKGVPVYCTPLMSHFLSRNGPWDSLVSGGHIRLEDNTSIDLGGVTVTAFKVPHRSEYTDTVGYRIEGPNRTAIFIPDIDRWTDWDEDVREVVEGVDYAFVDATFYSLDELPHRDIEKVRHPLVTDSMDRLDGLGGKVFFLHLNHTNPVFGDPSLVESRGFRLAPEGGVFEL